MADKVDMSLDDIIKLNKRQKKQQTQKKVSNVTKKKAALNPNIRQFRPQNKLKQFRARVGNSQGKGGQQLRGRLGASRGRGGAVNAVRRTNQFKGNKQQAGQRKGQFLRTRANQSPRGRNAQVPRRQQGGVQKQQQFARKAVQNARQTLTTRNKLRQQQARQNLALKKRGIKTSQLLNRRQQQGQGQNQGQGQKKRLNRTFGFMRSDETLPQPQQRRRRWGNTKVQQNPDGILTININNNFARKQQSPSASQPQNFLALNTSPSSHSNSQQRRKLNRNMNRGNTSITILNNQPRRSPQQTRQNVSVELQAKRRRRKNRPLAMDQQEAPEVEIITSSIKRNRRQRRQQANVPQSRQAGNTLLQDRQPTQSWQQENPARSRRGNLVQKQTNNLNASIQQQIKTMVPVTKQKFNFNQSDFTRAQTGMTLSARFASSDSTKNFQQGMSQAGSRQVFL